MNSRLLGALVIIGALGFAAVTKYYSDHDPEEVCKNQTAVPYKQCLDMSTTVEVAGL